MDLSLLRTGQGERVVFLHGWAGGKELWSKLISRLENFDCIAIDLPGHGDSPFPEKDTNFEKLSEYIFGNLKEFSPFHLVGWSQGGMVALQMAKIHPDWVQSLTLIGCCSRFLSTTGYSHGNSPGNLETIKKFWKKDQLKTLDWFRSQLVSKEERSNLTDRNTLQLFSKLKPPSKETGIYYLNLLGEVDLRNTLPSLEVPVIVIHGKKDKVIPFSAGEYLANNLKSAKMILLENTGHMPHITKPDEITNALKKFWKSANWK